MPDYQLPTIDIELLHQRARKNALSASWSLLRRPPNYDAAIKMYAAEYRFGTILNSVPADSNSIPIYQACLPDLEQTHLYIALAAWLRAPERDWTWERDLPDTRAHLANLQYGLAWQRNTKGFLIAARDLLQINRLTLSTQFDRDCQAEARRCAQLLFNSRRSE